MKTFIVGSFVVAGLYVVAAHLTGFGQLLGSAGSVYQGSVKILQGR